MNQFRHEHHWMIEPFITRKAGGTCKTCGAQKTFEGGIDWSDYGMQPMFNHKSKLVKRSDLRLRGVATRKK